jgi:tripartite-type tricarboxylate transporter receptor subunit TctC
MNVKTLGALLVALACTCAVLPLPANAQYPARPIHLVVPFPAGGPTDNVARSVAQAISSGLGQPIIIENRPGADGAIAAQVVAGAAPDGYTLLFASSSVMALPYVVKPSPFNAADLSPIASVGRLAFGLYVNPAVPSHSIREFIDYALANPGKLNYGSANQAEQLATAQFMKATGIDMVQISYKGSAQALPDLIAGRIQVYFGPVGAGIQHVKDGKLRMLATLVPQRLPIAREVPTMTESGLDSVSVQSYQMFVAPSKTPRDIIARLAQHVNAALQSPELRSQLENRGLFVESSTPEALSAMLREAGRDWTSFMQHTGSVAQ